MEGHPGNALADAFGHKRSHLRLRTILSAGDPDERPILDAAFGGVGRIDLDEHRLLQFGEPLIGSGFFAATFVFDNRPDERMSGNCLARPLSTVAFCTVNPIFGNRNCFASGKVGYLETSSTRGV